MSIAVSAHLQATPSPVHGGGMGWGRALALNAALLTPIPTFPRKRGKERRDR
jgi:hypothetical protein